MDFKVKDAPHHATVLIIEDDQTVASLLHYMLIREGYQPLVVSDGSAAQSTIAHLPQPPRLILLDLLLPFIDGFELLQQIRNRQEWHEVPVIVLSSKSQEQDIVRAFKLGASDYVAKPFQINELIARVHRLTNENAK